MKRERERTAIENSDVARARLHVAAGEQTKQFVFDIFIHLSIGDGVVDNRLVDTLEFLFIQIEQNNAWSEIGIDHQSRVVFPLSTHHTADRDVIPANCGSSSSQCVELIESEREAIERRDMCRMSNLANVPC